MSRAAYRGHIVLSILGCFGGGSLYGWSGYLGSVRAAFGVSNAAASMVFSIALVCFTLGVLLGPVLLARVRPGQRFALIAGLAACSLAVAGASPGFAVFAIAYGGAFGFASGALYNHTVSFASAPPDPVPPDPAPPNPATPDRASAAPTLLVPVTVAAFGLGGAVFGPVHVWLGAAGWGLWSCLPALASLAVLAVAALALPPLPERSGAAPPRFVVPDRTIARLWGIFAAGACSGLIVLGFAAQILPPAASGVGLASVAIFLAALGNTLGRLSSVASVRLFGPAWAVAGALGLSMLALASLIVAGDARGVVGLLFLVAFAYGHLAASIPLLVRSQVRGPEFSGAFGWVFTGWGVAGLLGPWSAGGFLDATGSLLGPLMGCIALTALALWLVVPFTKRGPITETR